MPVLTASGLAKSHGPRVLLKDVTVGIDDGERVGLVGRNGAGKSTLARILAGLEPPDAGEIAMRRDASIAYLTQEPVFPDTQTPREAVLEGLGAWKRAHDRHHTLTRELGERGPLAPLLSAQAEAASEIERLGGWDRMHAAQAVMDQLGIARPDAPLGGQSGGERRRVALARLLVSKPDLAILDEPTNHLDLATVEWLEGYLASSFTGALLLITHDRYLLDRVAVRTLEVENGAVHSYDGGWGRYLEAKAEREALAARTEDNRQRFVKTELEWLRRSPSARTGKQKARIKRAEDAMSSRGPEREQSARFGMETTRLGHTVLDLSDLRLEIEGRVLIDGLNLNLRKGERLGLLGANGAGKTTLLRALLGEVTPAAGRVTLGKHSKVAYLDQTRSGLEAGASVMENVAGSREKIEFEGRTMDVRTYLARFMFPPERVREKVDALSGGERARVALAKLMLSPANLLLLDEPSNDLDTTTLGALESMLLEADATALVVSHDRYFLDRVATGILAFEGDGRVVLYQGDYSTYRALRAASGPTAAAPAAGPSAEVSTPKPARPSTKPRRLGNRERRELESLPEAIEGAERRVTEITESLSDPSLYASRGDEVPALVASQEAARAEVEQLMARWEELEMLKEELEGG